MQPAVPFAVKPVPTWIHEKLRVFQDPRFSFEPVAHKYLLGDRELLSATSWLKQFSQPFDAPKVAAEREAATGRPAQMFLDDWNQAAWIGTKTHEFIEHFYQSTATREMVTCHPEVSVRCDKFLQLYQERLHTITPLAQELRVFHEPTGLCGTVDFLGQLEDGRVCIMDYKTSKKIDTDQDKIWRYLYKPFTHLGDNEHNKYSLQISLYRVLLEEAGIDTAGAGFLIWLPTRDKTAKIIKAVDLRKEVRQLIL